MAIAGGYLGRNLALPVTNVVKTMPGDSSGAHTPSCADVRATRRGAGCDREGRGTDRPGRTTEGSRSMMVSSPVAVTAEGKWNVTWWIVCS